MIKRVVAFIPARSGSKGLPNKNKRLLCGKPLVRWTIEAARASKCIDDVCVTSDDEDILSIARDSGVHALYRPKRLSGDKIYMYSVIDHASSWYCNLVSDFVYGILLQPTSPLRTSMHIDNCFQTMITKKADAAISVRLCKKDILKSFTISGSFLTPVFNKNAPFESRQQLPDCYIANGAIYIFLKSGFEKKQSFLLRQTIPFLMDDRDSIDIDSIEDFNNVEKVILTGRG